MFAEVQLQDESIEESLHQFLLSGPWCRTSLSDTTSPQAENHTCLVSLQPCFSFQEMHCLLGDLACPARLGLAA